MSSSSRRKFLVRHPVVVDVGCSCRRTKLSSLFSSPPSKPKAKTQVPPKHHHHPLSSYYPFSPSTTTTTTTNTSPWGTSHHPSSTSTTTTTMTSPYEDTSSPSSHPAAAAVAWTKKKKSPKKSKKTSAAAATSGGGRVGESVAVVKESDDPYFDFRDSMLQMIMENEIYAWEDLKELLNRFLALNSPYHHDVIVSAFAEIWNGVFSSSSGGPAVSKPARRGHGGPRLR